jgi:hypothetical protein
MVTLIIGAICLLACGFLIYVLVQFRRELNISSSLNSPNHGYDVFDSADWRLRHIWADRMAQCGDQHAEFQNFQLPTVTVLKSRSSTGIGKRVTNRKSDPVIKGSSGVLGLGRPRDIRHRWQYLASPRGLLSFASLGFMETGHAIESGDDRGSKKGKSNER